MSCSVGKCIQFVLHNQWTPLRKGAVDQQWKYAKYINKHTWFTFFIEVQRIVKISKIAFIVVGLLALQALFSKTENHIGGVMVSMLALSVVEWLACLP